jgi:hypothetical protein
MRAGDPVRESILERAGHLGLSTALAELPALLEREGLSERARRASPGLVDDTLAALVAFVLPGDDAFSVDQGESHPAPGGVSAGVVPLLREAIDHFGVRASAGVAVLLNRYAGQVDAAAGRGRFRAPFARLAHGQKAEALRLFESDPALSGTELRFAARILPGFVAFIAFSRAGVYAPSQRAVARRVVGWDNGPPPRGRRNS